MKNVLFLTLNTFSATGGIEKVCQVAGKALHEILTGRNSRLAVYAMHDGCDAKPEPYIPAENFKAFGGKRSAFVWSAIKRGIRCNTVVLSHINLLSVGFIIKKLSPRTRLILIAHGIEVWEPFGAAKTAMLKSVDLFLPVSVYTGRKLQQVHNVPSAKVRVLNNCLDPYLNKTSSAQIKIELQKRYGLITDGPVLLTLTRLKFSEQYKGYDKVIALLPQLAQIYPGIKYLVVGKYDADEKARLDQLIAKYDLQETVIFTGFVPDSELTAHFSLADMYIMPSTGEGFGIVFIEALFYGKPVIAGNVDGSVDAVDNGRLGLLVNPDNGNEIMAAVLKIAADTKAYVADENEVLKKFGFDTYKKEWESILPGGVSVTHRNTRTLAPTA